MQLTLDNVTVAYAAEEKGGSAVRALDSLNLDVAQGESVAIIGPSGCGKSTMLRLASGLLKPNSGQVLADGELLAGPRKGTALILQDFGLLPWKTVYDNAELGILIHKIAPQERRERTLAALEKVGLAGFEKSYPSQLSGGMKQRLALARAIAMDVDALLMDEPLSALDAILREELQDMLLSLWEERRYTQILVTHSIEEAVFLGQRIIVMAPRTSRVVASISNPEMGSLSYRTDDIFFERCREVRAALAAGRADTVEGGQR